MKRTARRLAVVLGGFWLGAGAMVAADSRSLLLAGRQLPRAVVEHEMEKALAEPVVAITAKSRPSPSGDARDYVSYARYWWPDPTKPDGLPFVRKDGLHNREQVAAGDRAKVERLIGSVSVLAIRWSQDQREECARRAGEWLRKWFVAPETRMNPSLDYAQVRLGRNNNRGSAAGVIDTRDFATLVAALARLEDSLALTAEEWVGVRAWFESFFVWLTTSPLGLAERKTDNNHATWYFVQTVAIARYLGRDEEARKLALEARGRLRWQMNRFGRQPEELARADGLGYSVFNLEAWLALAQLARPVGVELWHYEASNGASLKKSLDFLRPYNVAPRDWPYPQRAKLEPGFLDELTIAAAALEAGSAAIPANARGSEK